MINFNNTSDLDYMKFVYKAFVQNIHQPRLDVFVTEITYTSKRLNNAQYKAKITTDEENNLYMIEFSHAPILIDFMNRSISIGNLETNFKRTDYVQYLIKELFNKTFI